MKDQRTSVEDVECCPLCNSDEFLISSAGSMLCAQCGSFFESVHLIVPTVTYQANVDSMISRTPSVLAN
ncbi:hypothetical protein [Vibrio ponticus]|uniref:hypothetical protein n=1 Tax=Vibrio ponticus TaxID=265668 RepID=UPI001387345B|nr:hypothetical protein [Vibrio ponticus]